MAKKPLMQKISIKSMNQKIRRVGEKFGVESLPYKQLIADIERDFRGMTHTTKKGFLQVTQSKTFTPNEYQIGVINRVAARQGVKEITKKALERMGLKRATAEDIRENVRKYTEMQNKFDDTLDKIYELEKHIDLPFDIVDTYSKLYNRGTGGGQGVSSNEVEWLENVIPEYENLRDEMENIYSDINEIIRSNGGNLPENLSNDVYSVKAGQTSFDDMKSIIDKMQNYLTNISNSFDPLQVPYE